MGFYFSFHHARDLWRLRQILNIPGVEGQTILAQNDWETIHRKGTKAVHRWIDLQMGHAAAVIVLVGAETADRPLVTYEIERAWDDRRPLLGIRVNGLHDAREATDARGGNPFENVPLWDGSTAADYVPVVDPAGCTSTERYRSLQSYMPICLADAFTRPGAERGLSMRVPGPSPPDTS